MQGLYFNGDDKLELREFIKRDLLKGEARVEVEVSGICGTDLAILAGDYLSHPPVVMGHEVSGIVVEVGSEVDQELIGARVAMETFFSTCEECRYCRDGSRNLCTERKSIGSYVDGGFADEIVVPAINLHVLPDRMTPVEGCLVEPLACVVNGLLDPNVIRPGDRVLVIGPGAIGLVALQVAVACGASVDCAGLDSDVGKLAVAVELGAIVTFRGSVPTDRYDVVIECSGSIGGAKTAISAAAKGGTVVQLSLLHSSVSIDYSKIVYKELTVRGSFSSTATSWRRAVELLHQGKVSFEALVTHLFDLSEWQEGFAQVNRSDTIKVALSPNAKKFSHLIA